MNKKQLIILWFGIGLVSLILLFPAKKKNPSHKRGTIGPTLIVWDNWKIPVTRTKLCLIASATAAGLIVTFKNKKSKDEQN